MLLCIILDPKFSSTESALASYVELDGRPELPALNDEKTPTQLIPILLSCAHAFIILPVIAGSSPTVMPSGASNNRPQQVIYYYVLDFVRMERLNHGRFPLYKNGNYNYFHT